MDELTRLVGSDSLNSYSGDDNDKSKKEPAAPEQSITQTLSDCLRIFSMATAADKTRIFMALGFTIAHGMCFLALAMILGKLTEPFITQSIYGYANGTTSVEEAGNQTHLLTKSEFIEEMESYSTWLLMIALAVFIFSYLQTYFWETSAESQCYNIRKGFTYQVLRRDIDWFHDHKPLPLCYRLSDGVENVREGIGHKFSMVLQYAIICWGQITFALLTNWKLTMIFLTISPLPVVLAKFLNFGKLLAAKGETEKQKYARASAGVSQTLENVRRVFAWGKENFEIERYRQSLADAANTATNKYLVQSIGIGIFLVLLMGSYAIAFQRACSNIEDHSATSADMYMVFFTVTIAVFSLGQILPWISTIASGHGSSRALEEILTLPDPPIDSSKVDPNQTILPALTGNMRIKDVTFSYPSKINFNLLDNLSLDLKPGTSVGIIGSTQSGKSSIVNLIFRHYDPKEGNISVDEVDIKKLNLAWYRKKIGVVGQYPVELMDGTVLDNIRAGRRDISLDKVIEAATLVNLHETVCNWEKGYSTDVAEINWGFMPAVKVQVAIVRALVRDPVWLVVDDKVSMLTGVVKLLKQTKMVKLYTGTKTIHMTDMDIIHVLEGGKIIESGTFEELMALKGRFFEMNQAETHQSDSRMLVEGDLVVPDEDDALVAQIIADAKRAEQKYPGFWKMLTLTNYSVSDWSLWVLAAIGCLLAGLLIPLFADFYTDIFTAFGRTSAGFYNDSKFWTLVLLGLAGMAAIGFCMRALFVQAAGEFMILRLRTLSLMSIMARPLTWFEIPKNSPTNLANRLADGVPYIKAALDNRFSIALSGFISIVAAIILALILGWQFGIGLLAFVLVILALVAYQIHYQRESQKISHDLLAKADMVFKQAVQQIQTIQYLSREHEMRQTYTNLIHGYLRDRTKSCQLFSFMHALTEMLVYVLLGSSLYYGAYLVEVDAMEPIVVFRVFLILTFCLISFEHTTSFIPDYSKAELAFGRIVDLLEEEDGSLELSRVSGSGKRPLKWVPTGRVKFDNVTSPHGAKRFYKIVGNCSFEVPPGKTLAIAGKSQDKSALLDLIMRFFDISDGRILIDGRNIREVDISELRGNIGYVPKEPDLFQGTISDNILYGYRGAKAEDFDMKALVDGVINQVGLDSYVLQLPDRLQTLIDEHCSGISELVQRKIMLARALVRNPKILLIDEPMGHLDDNEKSDILDILDRAKVGRTCILTTRNPVTLKIADLVGMFGLNNLTQFGTKEELAVAGDEKSDFRKFTKALPTSDSTTGASGTVDLPPVGTMVTPGVTISVDIPQY